MNQDILVDGNPNCEHLYLLYVNNRREGQYWKCDNPECGRKEWTDSKNHLTIKFPPGAFIRSKRNKKDIYRYQADEKGIVRGELDSYRRIHRKDLTTFIR